MPNSICEANLASGFDKPSQSSEENFVHRALSRERILLSCTGDYLRGGLDSQKPFYHGFPSPLTLRSQQIPDPPRLSLIGYQILGKLLLFCLMASFLSIASEDFGRMRRRTAEETA